MSKFKVDDRVRRIAYSNANAQIGEVYTVHSVIGADIAIFKGGPAIYAAHNFELATPVEPTDKELADEYRALRTKATEIGSKLIDRGYKAEVKLSIYSGWNGAPFYEAPEFRFTKTVTTTEEV